MNWQLGFTAAGTEHAVVVEKGKTPRALCSNTIRVYVVEGSEADATNTPCANCKRVMGRIAKQKARGEMYQRAAQEAARAEIPNDWQVQLALRPGATGYSWACSCGQRYDGTDNLRDALGYLVGHAVACREAVAS